MEESVHLNKNKTRPKIELDKQYMMDEKKKMEEIATKEVKKQ